MKKISTLVGLLSLGAMSFAQSTVSEELINENFENAIPASFVTSPNSSIGTMFAIDGSDKILQLKMTQNSFFKVEWTAIDLPEIDSLVITSKLNKDVNGTNTGSFAVNEDNELTLSSNLFLATTYRTKPLTFTSNTILNFGTYTSVVDNGTYLSLTKKIEGPIYQDTKVPVLAYVSQLPGNYLISCPELNLMGTGTTIETAAQQFCFADQLQYGTPLFTCIAQLTTVVPATSINGGIDDVVITSYSTVTGIEDAQAANKEISGVYNLMGQESSIEATNQVLVVKYTDGSSERVYNVR